MNGVNSAPSRLRNFSPLKPLFFYQQSGAGGGVCAALLPVNVVNLALIFFLFLIFSLGHTRHMLDIMSRLPQVVASLRTSMAARCVKFAPGSSHLLAIAEHQGTAHLVNYVTS